MTIIERLARRIEEAEGGISGRPLLVALSGIDGSGKSTMARELETALVRLGRRVALIHADDWHRLRPGFPARDEAAPRTGLSGSAGEPALTAERFYEEGFRFDEMFSRLIEPLLRTGSCVLEMDRLGLPPEGRERHTYRFERLDVILVEGIFLFRRELRDRYDYRVWIGCSFETALRRALLRNQESLPEDRLREDYRRIYFAAQDIHFDRDHPWFFADAILINDPSWQPRLLYPRTAPSVPPRRRPWERTGITT